MKVSNEIQPSSSKSHNLKTLYSQEKDVEDLEALSREIPEGETEFQYEKEKEPEGGELEDVFEPPRRTHWVMTTFLMISYLIGVGVLSLPSAFVSLGWVPGVLLLTGVVFITTVTGLYMWKLHMKYPHIRSYAAMYYHFFGRAGQIIGGTLTYLMFFWHYDCRLSYCCAFLEKLIPGSPRVCHCLVCDTICCCLGDWTTSKSSWNFLGSICGSSMHISSYCDDL